jgi:hypothetical protein
MTGLVRNGSSPWFALSYGADGSVFITARAAQYIPSSTLMKVTFAPSGFIAYPFESEVEEFYVGWTPQAMSANAERTIQIGGVIGPILSIRRGNAWLQEAKGAVIEKESPFRPANAFGFALSLEKVMLFPVMVKGGINT